MSGVSLLFVLTVVFLLATVPPIVVLSISRGRLPVGYPIPLVIGVVAGALFAIVIMALVLPGLVEG
jgi:hypothetical protein